MDILKTIQIRQSTRNYSPVPVEREKLERCLEAARLAPSACNAQPWKFIVVDEPELKKEVAGAAKHMSFGMNQFVDEAPVIIAIVMEPANVTSEFGSKIKRKHYPLMDIGIAAEHFCLQATEEGLGTCLLGWLNEKKAKKALNIPSRRRVPLMISVGYPATDKKKSRKRKDLDKIVSYNAY
ncbi:MAG: nitroreductase family protein [Bacteroidales bacterium]